MAPCSLVVEDERGAADHNSPHQPERPLRLRRADYLFEDLRPETRSVSIVVGKTNCNLAILIAN